jgi:hypothetical protein
MIMNESRDIPIVSAAFADHDQTARMNGLIVTCTGRIVIDSAGAIMPRNKPDYIRHL